MENRRAERMPWIIVIMLVAAVCLVAWLGAYAIKKSSADSAFGSYTALSGAQSMEVKIAGDGFVYYDGSAVTRMDSGGSVVWNYYVGGGAEFSASASGVAVWNGRKLTIIDIENGTTTYSGDQDTEVSDARVGSKYAAALLEGDGISQIVVLEKGGRQVYTAELDQLTAVDFGFYSGGSQLWVMALDTTGSIPTCEITTYSPRSMSIVGQISDTEQLMYHVSFQSESVNCTGVTYYKAYDYNGREITESRKLVYGWYLMSAETGDDPLMAFVPNGQAETGDVIQDVRMMRSDVDRTVHLPFPCAYLETNGDKVYGFASDGHVIIARPGRQKADAYQMPFYIDRVYGVTSSGVAVISSGDTLYLLSLNMDE